jgi:hypothetical protein
VRKVVLTFPIAAAIALFSPSGAAAVTIGSDLAPNGGNSPCAGGMPCTQAQTALPGAQITSPVDGTVVRWRLRPGQTGISASNVRLRVLRPAGGGLFATVSSSTTQTTGVFGTPTTLTFPTQQPVRTGDNIGIDILSNPGNLTIETAGLLSGYTIVRWQPPVADGIASSPNSTFTNSHELLLNADVDPATIAITGHPRAKVKTRKKKSLVKFAFTSNVPGIGFLCTRDAGPASPCTSPFSYAARLGSHTFTVQGADKTGAFGPSTSYAFRVKKRKKKH